jgi:antitoxin HicB
MTSSRMPASAGRPIRGWRSSTETASTMSTSRSQLDRVLDPDNLSIQLDTLIKAARAVGKEVEIKISKTPRAASAR